MKHVLVEHGPPGVRGVSQIMGLAGPDEIAPIDERLAGATRRTGLIAAGALAYGLVSGRGEFVTGALGLAVGALLVRHWSK